MCIISLLEAYEEQPNEKKKETLLSDIKFGKTQRYFNQQRLWKIIIRAGLGVVIS